MCLSDVSRDAYTASDIRAIAAGPLFYPLTTFSRCREADFDNENHLQQQQYETASPAAHCDDPSSSAVADFLGERKLRQTG